MKYRLTYFFCLSVLMISGQSRQHDFDEIDNIEHWNLVFEDECTKDWTEKWTLDGLVATVKNSKDGMHFKAGTEYKNDAHHGVLWTKASFSGDIKIEYDYTRTDNATKCVNILYIQASGDEEGPYKSDISKWSHLRSVPSMKIYFENMNAFHISYSAFGNEENSTHYIRARRYPKPYNMPFDVTQIKPSYDEEGYFKTGEAYHITVIKTASHLFFKMEGKTGIEIFHWDVSNITPILEGRIGLRHMFTRSALYKNIKIYTK